MGKYPHIIRKILSDGSHVLNVYVYDPVNNGPEHTAVFYARDAAHAVRLVDEIVACSGYVIGK